MKKNYLVTGGAGFIGSHLVDQLIKDGHVVVIIDNLLTGRKENLNPKAKFIRADIRDVKKIQPHFQKMNGVFHIAALPRVQPSIDDPLTPNDCNTTGTLNVLWAAKEAGVKRVVYASSSSVYGDSKIMPLKESFPPSPLSPYALQKWAGEEYCRLFSKIYNLETVSLRYFNVYGPRMIATGAYATVIKIFFEQKKRGESLKIVGDGEQSRDFTHVFDVVCATIAAMVSPKIGQGEIINIGRGGGYSVNQIAALIGGPTTHIPARPEPRRTQADNTLAKKLLNWMPRESLEKTIAEMLEGRY